MSDGAAFDANAIVEVLVKHRVTFVVIGGCAAELQGVSWSTVDLDIVIEAREENYIALAAALEELDAWCLVPKGSLQRIRPDVDRLRSLTGTFLLRTRHGRLDVMKSGNSGAEGPTYVELAADAVGAKIEVGSFLLASLESLVRMKRAANREKDRKAIVLLEAEIARRRDASS
jgi:hypothetical protein